MNVNVHDDGPQGMRYIWLCPKCGQPLAGAGVRCNDKRPSAVRSIDLRESALREVVAWLYEVRDHEGNAAEYAARVERELLP